MLGTVMRTNLLGRNVVKTFRRHGSHGGVPGENLPFSLNSRAWITWNMFWYTGTGIGAPFVILAYQIQKK